MNAPHAVGRLASLGQTERMDAMSSTRWLRQALGSLALALLSAGGVVGVWLVFVRTTTGQRLDDLAFVGARIGAWRVVNQAYGLLDYVSVGAIALAILIVVVIAFARRRWWRAVEAAAVIAAANITTQILKYAVFTRTALVPWPELSEHNTLPSGHTTAAASAAVAALLVAPPRLRSLFAIAGAAVMVAFGYATLVGQWHRPSDVVAGYLVCLCWAFAAMAATGFKRALLGPGRHELDARRPTARWVPAAMAWTGAVLLLPSALLAAANRHVGSPDSATRAQQFSAYAGASMSFVAVSLAGMGVLAWLVSAMDRPAPVDADRASEAPRWNAQLTES